MARNWKQVSDSFFFGFVWNVPAYFLYSLQRTYFWFDLSFWINYYVLKKEEITSKQIYAWIFVTLFTCIIGIIAYFSFLWCPTSGCMMLRLRVIYFTSKKSMCKLINNFQIEKGKVFPRNIIWSEIENEKVYYCLLFWICLQSIMPSWDCF